MEEEKLEKNEPYPVDAEQVLKEAAEKKEDEILEPKQADDYDIYWEDGKLVFELRKGKRVTRVRKKASEVRILNKKVKQLVIVGQRRGHI